MWVDEKKEVVRCADLFLGVLLLITKRYVARDDII